MELSDLDDSSSSDMTSEEEFAVLTPTHMHRKRFSLVEISNRNFVRKIMTFETRCAVLPSSWEVEFKITKGAQFENFMMTISIRRMDSSQISLKGYLHTYLSNFEDKLCPYFYSMEGVVPYFERLGSDARREVTQEFPIDDHYTCLFMDGRESFRYDMLLIKTQFLVMGCCSSSGQIGVDPLMVRSE